MPVKRAGSAARAGKAILCEKPLAGSLADAMAVVATVCGVVIAAGQTTEFSMAALLQRVFAEERAR